MAVHRLWAAVTCLLVMLVHLLWASAKEVAVECSGGFWCQPRATSDDGSVGTYFQYIPSSGLCVEVEAGKICVPAGNCSFHSTDECYGVCGRGRESKAACASTQYGCCGDGVTVREGEGGCPEAAASEEGGGGGGGDSTVHWSVVMSGVCGAVLLLGLVAVVGLSTYAYRHRHRARQRWYIHEVLQMYDGGDSSESGADTDSSWDDPEHKNLFDRL